MVVNFSSKNMSFLLLNIHTFGFITSSQVLFICWTDKQDRFSRVYYVSLPVAFNAVFTLSLSRLSFAGS